MAFYFRPFPKVQYDLKKNKLPLLLTNVTARYKIRDRLKDRVAIYYNYVVQDSDRPDLIAYKYYNDETLDWLIYLVNDIIDPYYDWPLAQDPFNKYMTTLYGSVAGAKATVFEYRKLLNKQKVLFVTHMSVINAVKSYIKETDLDEEYKMGKIEKIF